jgi:hypothetical protein
MIYILYVFWVASFVVCVLCVGSLIRNEKVFKLRMSLLDQVFAFPDYEWRLKVFKSVSYNQMVHSFKSIKAESFYPDLSFLKPSISKQDGESVLSPMQLPKPIE